MLTGMRQAKEGNWIALFEFSDSSFKFIVLDDKISLEVVRLERCIRIHK